MSMEEIETAALKLDPPLRAKLAASLLGSLETLPESEIERLWIEEAQRRADDLEAGTATERPADEVMRDAWARIS